MTRRSFKYFKQQKVLKVVIRPVIMLEKQHYGHAEWLANFAQAWERSVVSLNHLSNQLHNLGDVFKGVEFKPIVPPCMNKYPNIMKEDIGGKCE